MPDDLNMIEKSENAKISNMDFALKFTQKFEQSNYLRLWALFFVMDGMVLFIAEIILPVVLFIVTLKKQKIEIRRSIVGIG